MLLLLLLTAPTAAGLLLATDDGADINATVMDNTKTKATLL
jgi:hypothetical protein